MKSLDEKLTSWNPYFVINDLLCPICSYCDSYYFIDSWRGIHFSNKLVTWQWNKTVEFTSSRNCAWLLKTLFYEYLLTLVVIHREVLKGNCWNVDNCPFKQLAWCHYLLVMGRWRLALAANLFTVPPTPSQALFPKEVAEKCHSAATPKSCSWWHKLIKFFRFLYCTCDATPSEPY